MKKLILIILMTIIFLPAFKADSTPIPPTENQNSNEESTQNNETENKEENTQTTSSPINLKSQSGIVIEASTKKVLFEKSSNEKLAPASMTKVMTMLLIMEELEKGNIRLEDEVVISKNAADMGGSQVYLEANSKATVKELLVSIGIGSANDAAVAMAEKIGGTESNFVAMMNKRAKELGCHNTNFMNSHGLDQEGHYTTSYDMALMASELVKHENILDITSTYETTLTHQNGNSIWLVNTNSLIRFYQGLDGLKTGFTDNAGYCLTGTMERNGMRLITVVMKGASKEDRNTDTINMMEYAFSMFYKDTLIPKDKVLGQIFIDNTSKRRINYYLEEDASVILGKDTKEINYKYDIELEEVKAPLKNGDRVGILTLKYDGGEKNYNLVVNEEVKPSGFFRRMINYLKDIVSGNVNVINF